MTQTAQYFEAQITQIARLNYLLYLPPDYDNEQRLPMIVFLHGTGARGNDPELIK